MANRGQDRSAKDKMMASYMKAHHIMRAGSDATLPAVEHRMKHAVNAGGKPPGGWNGSGRNAPLNLPNIQEKRIRGWRGVQVVA